MTPVVPIQQPPIEDLRNALQIAQACGDDPLVYEGVTNIFKDIARLIRHAIEGLSEPNAAAIRDATVMLRAAMGPTAFELAEPRLARSVAEVILHAQVTGYSPETL